MKISQITMTIVAVALLHSFGITARADMLVAYTSFEEPSISLIPGTTDIYPTTYHDPGNAAVDHALVNTTATEMPVTYSSVGGELGFSAFYYNTRNLPGLTDGGTTGVLHDGPFVNSAILHPTNGIQQYTLSGVDGKVTVTLDSVNLAGLVNPQVALDFFLRSTSWAADNYAHIWLDVDNGGSVSQITLLDTRPTDIDVLNPSLEGHWTSRSATLPSNTVATLKFEVDAGDAGNSRLLGVDNIRFTAAPEPGSLVLAGIVFSAVVAAVRRRPRHDSAVVG